MTHPCAHMVPPRHACTTRRHGVAHAPYEPFRPWYAPAGAAWQQHWHLHQHQHQRQHHPQPHSPVRTQKAWKLHAHTHTHIRTHAHTHTLAAPPRPLRGPLAQLPPLPLSVPAPPAACWPVRAPAGQQVSAHAPGAALPLLPWLLLYTRRGGAGGEGEGKPPRWIAGVHVAWQRQPRGQAAMQVACWWSTSTHACM